MWLASRASSRFVCLRIQRDHDSPGVHPICDYWRRRSFARSITLTVQSCTDCRCRLPSNKKYQSSAVNFQLLLVAPTGFRSNGRRAATDSYKILNGRLNSTLVLQFGAGISFTSSCFRWSCFGEKTVFHTRVLCLFLFFFFIDNVRCYI